MFPSLDDAGVRSDALADLARVFFFEKTCQQGAQQGGWEREDGVQLVGKLDRHIPQPKRPGFRTTGSMTDVK